MKNTHTLMLTWKNFIPFQKKKKALQLRSYMFLLNYVRKRLCGNRVFISTTLQYLSSFHNHIFEQVYSTSFTLCMQSCRKFRKTAFFFFFLKIGNPPAISQNGGSFKNIQQVSEQCYITQLILTCFFWDSLIIL